MATRSWRRVRHLDYRGPRPRWVHKRDRPAVGGARRQHLGEGLPLFSALADTLRGAHPARADDVFIRLDRPQATLESIRLRQSKQQTRGNTRS